MKNNQYIRQTQYKKGFAMVWVIILVVLVLVGWIWFKNFGYQYLNYYVFHKGMPPGYCGPGPCQ